MTVPTRHRTLPRRQSLRRLRNAVLFAGLCVCWGNILLLADTVVAPVDGILAQAHRSGGLVGCVDVDDEVLLALQDRGGWFIHALYRDPAKVPAARVRFQRQGLGGRVVVDQLRFDQLPYIDNLLNLLIVNERLGLAENELLRVLCPHGEAWVKDEDRWTSRVKERPAAIDEWTHYLYDATNNAVAHDQVVAPPRRLQWTAGPRYARHHDRMSSVSAVVSSGGKIFSIIDVAPDVSILFPPEWKLIARDAFNGVVLWERDIDHWFSHLWPLKSGPAQLPRRLIAQGDRVYVTLGINAPLTCLDAVTGKTLHTYSGTASTEEAILDDGVLYLLVNRAAKDAPLDGSTNFAQGYHATVWDETTRRIVALRADSGELLWSAEHVVLPGTLAAKGQHLVFHDGTRVVCLDAATGGTRWSSQPIDRAREIRGFYLPILVLYENLVLFSGGETAGDQTGSWYMSGKDTMTALELDTGKELWNAYHPPSGYRSPEDLLVANGLVWTGETTSGRAAGLFTGRDPWTGEIKRHFEPDVDTYWFHHRCYRGKGTDRFLLMSRTGVEFVDLEAQRWDINHWVRGACLYGVMPANGLLYTPQHPCACYLEAKLSGFNALAPADPGPRFSYTLPDHDRLVEGPAYRRTPVEVDISRSGDWPTYRHDAERSGNASTPVNSELDPAWQVHLGGQLTSPIVADGRVYVAAMDEHTLYALDAVTGESLWRFVAGGRIDSPPTYARGRLLFGSADGWVYCLQAADGELAWQFLAAPGEQRLMAYDQLESVWPVHGNILVQNGIAYFVAGRSMFLDDGMLLWRLDAHSGEILSKTVLNEYDSQGADLQDYVSWLNMPPALPDILSSDGRRIFMRSQPFDLDGKRLPLEAMPRGEDADQGAPQPTQDQDLAHIFSPTGFLDDAWWHRSYWLYGSRFISGWQGYYLAGRAAPAGRILVMNESQVFGFGRQPRYYRWSTPIEHHLFCADKKLAKVERPARKAHPETVVQIAKAPSLNPAGQAITAMAWVKPDEGNGVILARGGAAQGYALYVKSGRGHFAIRSGEELTIASTDDRIVGRWAHLAGVLTEDNELQIYVDGECVGRANAPEKIKADPLEALDIGADEGSNVGDYEGRFAFTGTIDEVRVYHRGLSRAAITELMSNAGIQKDRDQQLVLYLPLDNGTAKDRSGHDHHGEIRAATSTGGKIKTALRFVGGQETDTSFLVQHHWAEAIPLFARAMLLADETLFLAGPDDLIDEPRMFQQFRQPGTQALIAEQLAAYRGEKGAALWAVSAKDGRQLAEYRLSAPPVFDGMAAAHGCVYLATMDGHVVCWKSR